MSADFNKPVKQDQYDAVLTLIRDNQEALARQDMSVATNVPDGAIQFNTTNSRWEKRVKGAWQALKKLSHIFEMKVRDSDKLNGENADFYRNADNLNDGVIDANRIPGLSAKKITHDTLDTKHLPTTDSFNLNNHKAIPLSSAIYRLYHWVIGQLNRKASLAHSHSANHIRTGSLAAARIPGLSANKITSGILAAARIPELSANKITSGILAAARIPKLSPAHLPNTNSIEDLRVLSSRSSYRCCRENRNGLCKSHGTCVTTTRTLQKKINGTWMNVGAV